MFESYELPKPEAIAGLDDRGLVDAMAVATIVESAAMEVRFAAIQEMYARQSPARGPSRPPRPRAALPSSRRRRGRKARKRRRRR